MIPHNLRPPDNLEQIIGSLLYQYLKLFSTAYISLNYCNDNSQYLVTF